MLCSRCKRRTAVVFVSSGKDSSSAEGFCFSCAKEVGIKPLQNLMDKMNISGEELESMGEQFSDAFGAGFNPDELNIGSEENGFTPGGAATFPFIKGLFSNMMFQGKDDETEKNKESKDFKSGHKTKRKMLGLYCNNLTLKAKEGKLDKVVGREKEINRTVAPLPGID